MTNRESADSDIKKPSNDNKLGGAYKDYIISSSGNREGGCGTSLNGMFRGDCEHCDHIFCDQCNWVEQK